jgi:hypothetical protein
VFRDVGSGQQRAISRANRLLYWHDMLIFRDKGFNIFDLGGYYPDWAPADPHMKRINEFKASFGGRLLTEANYLSCALHGYRVSHAAYRRARAGKQSNAPELG